jgi:transposase
MTSKGTEKMSNITIGIDISKDTLDAHRLPDGTSRRFANTPAGHKALIVWAGRAVTRIVFEPTGPYHAAFERALAKAGLPIVKVNPRQARRFAEATGTLIKTDRVDATVLARMGLALDLQARPAPDANLAELRELHLARAALIKDRTAAKTGPKSSASRC